MLADLNVDPPESDGEDHPPTPNPAIAAVSAAAPAVTVDPSTRSCNEEGGLTKNAIATKDPDTVECEDADQHYQGASVPREEKVSNLKAALVHVARKMPKNAHAHFMLGLMYQRLGQPQKAILAYEKSSEILLQDEEEVWRPDLLTSVRVYHAQCISQTSMGDSFDEELEIGELDEILIKLKSSVESDPRQAAVWNILGLVLLRGGQLQIIWTPLRIFVLHIFKGLNFEIPVQVSFPSFRLLMSVNFRWESRAVCKMLSRACSERSKPPSCSGELRSSPSM